MMLLEALLLQRAVRLLPLLLLQVDGMEVAVLQGWLRLHQSYLRQSAGRKVGGDDSRKIPTQGKREVAITLKDSLGRSVVFRERVTISDAVSQPTLCFGKMMEQGWSIDEREQ